jgi:hypothetical protein
MSFSQAWGLLLLLPLSALAAGSDVDNPPQYFMRLCLKDTTVAAGRREQICGCLRDAFAYGDNAWGLSDVIALDPRYWEAPEKRMPQDDLGNEVRRARRDCMAGGGVIQTRANSQ